MAKSKSAASSNIRNVLQSITVGRNGKVVRPEIGKPFEFTAEEIEQIEAANPAAISTVLSVNLADADAVQTMADTVAGAAGSTQGEGSL